MEVRMLLRSKSFLGSAKKVPLISCNACNQQRRCYRFPELPKNMQRALDRHRKPFIPGETALEHVQDWQKKPENVMNYKRKAWAKFGATSGVDPATLLPSREEIEEELQAEKEWWPTLQELLGSVKQKKDLKQQKKEEYWTKVSENMAKMPEWIKEWEQEQLAQQTREEKEKEKRKALTEQAKEEFGYDLADNDFRVKEYVKDQFDREKALKKKARKLGRQMKME